MLTRRRALTVLAGSTAGLCLGEALAQSFPVRPITMVVPYPAGGPTDAIGRIIADDMARALGQSIVIENKSGAAGSVGTRSVARAEPDGHTIVFGNNQTHGNNFFLVKDLGYDPVADFAPLAGIGAFQHAFVVRNGLPAISIAELVALAKKEPGKLNYGSTGNGSGSHLAMELFKTISGTDMVHIPFRGAADLAREIAAGRIDLSLSTLPSVLGQIRGGAMRCLAMASPARVPQLPDAPTLAESGVRGAEAESWAGFFAPAKTPGPIVDALSRAILGAMKKDSVRAAIDHLGFTIELRDPAAFRPYHLAEISKWAEVIRKANVKTDAG